MDLSLQVQRGEHSFVHDVQLGGRIRSAFWRDQEVGIRVREEKNVIRSTSIFFQEYE